MKLIQKPFYFMRHGQTEWNQKGLCAGQSDIELNEHGRQQAAQAKKIVSDLKLTSLFYSPLKRAKETMKIATHGLDLPRIEVSDLKEWNFGTWEEKEWSQPLSDITQLSPPEGESSAHFLNRCLNGLNWVLEHEGTPLIVAHSGTYWAINHFLGTQREYLENCQVIHCAPAGDQWQITCIK